MRKSSIRLNEELDLTSISYAYLSKHTYNDLIINIIEGESL